MRVKKNKEISGTNIKLIGVVIGSLLIIAIVSYLMFNNANNTKEKAASITGLANGATTINKINSPLIQQKRKSYEAAQELKAKSSGKSYLASVGSVNTILANFPKADTTPKGNDKYNYDAERKKRLLQQNKDTLNNKQKTNNSISAKFLEALKDPQKILGKNQNNKKVKASSFQTVTPPNYYERAAIKNKKSAINKIIGEITAGTTLYGHMVNSVNTDLDSAVVVKIDIGKFKGAVLVGKYNINDKWVEGVSLEFKEFTFKSVTTQINAFAINADYSPNLYNDINHHYLQRFGGLIASATFGAIKGAAKPYQGANQPVVIVSGGGQTNSVYTPPDTKQIAYSAAGGAATDISTQLQPSFKAMWNRPATISINQGHGIGILFIKTALIKGDKSSV